MDFPVEATLHLTSFQDESKVRELLWSYDFTVTKLDRHAVRIKGSFFNLKAVKVRLEQLRDSENQTRSKSESSSRVQSTSSGAVSNWSPTSNPGPGGNRGRDSQLPPDASYSLAPVLGAEKRPPFSPEADPSTSSSPRREFLMVGDENQTRSESQSSSRGQSRSISKLSSPANPGSGGNRDRDSRLPFDASHSLVPGTTYSGSNSSENRPPVSPEADPRTSSGPRRGFFVVDDENQIRSASQSSTRVQTPSSEAFSKSPTNPGSGANRDRASQLASHASLAPVPGATSSESRPPVSPEPDPSTSSSPRRKFFVVDADVYKYAARLRKKDLDTIRVNHKVSINVREFEDSVCVVVQGRNAEAAASKLQSLLSSLDESLRTQDVLLTDVGRRGHDLLERIRRANGVYNSVLVCERRDSLHLVGSSRESYDLKQRLLGPMKRNPRK